MARQTLAVLKKMVQELEDRDLGLKRDMSLFESVFDCFPVPVVIWMLDSEGSCVSRRVAGAASEGWVIADAAVCDVSKTYRCPQLQQRLNGHLARAAAGERVSFLCSNETVCIWTRLVPRFDHDRQVGVIGISMDISSSYRSLGALQAVLNDSEDAPLPASTREAVSQAVDNSLMAQLLMESDSE